jgi:DNA-binding response OmpR family regulator
MDRYVVYVDDDPDDRLIMEDAFLNIPDYELEVFPNGNKLLDFLKGEKERLPSLIILDVNMPFLSGIDVLRLLKSDEAYQSVPVVMFSTSTSPIDKQQCKDHGADLVVKPLSYKEALATCRNLLAYTKKD